MLTFNYTILANKTEAKGDERLFMPGAILARFTDDQGRVGITRMNPAQGWPTMEGSGDPFLDGQGRVGFNTFRTTGGQGQVENVRVKLRMDRKEAVRGGGAYDAWFGANVGVYVDDLGLQPSTGFLRQKFGFAAVGGASYVTPNTADWPFDSQHNPSASGEDLRSEFTKIVQDWYFPDMAYPLGACSANNLSVLLKPEATALSGEPDGRDPHGRPWLGWTMDGLGTMRRIPDLPESVVYDMADNAGMRPPPADLVSSSGFGWGWQIIRPLAPATADLVNAMGVIQYSENYVRVPNKNEFVGFMTSGRTSPLYSMNPEALTIIADPDVWNSKKLPVQINEGRTVLMSCVFGVNRFGIAAQPLVTGKASSRSIRIDYLATGAIGAGIRYTIYMNLDGSFVAYLQSSGYANGGSGNRDFQRLNRYDGAPNSGQQPRYHVTPNGWSVPVLVPTINLNPDRLDYVDNPNFAVIARFPNQQNLGASPPAKPSDAPEGWVPPPFDMNIPWWGGLRYIDNGVPRFLDDTGSTSETHSGQVRNVSLYPMGNENYIADGAYQWYGAGTIVIFQGFDAGNNPFYGAHSAKAVVPGALGPGGEYKPYAEVDGINPAVRYFPWPGTPIAITRRQHSGWQVTFNGSTWQDSSIDFGPAQGTTVVLKDVIAPSPPKPDASV